MKNPNPVNLQSSAEVRERGWQAESRDADGHLISCHAPIEADDPGIAEWIVECTSRGETLTFWPTNGEVAATQPPPPSSHVDGSSFIADVHAVVDRQDFGKPTAEKRGRTSDLPYVPVIDHDGRTEQIKGFAFPDRDAAIEHAAKTIAFRRAYLFQQLKEPRLRALRQSHGLPADIPATPAPVSNVEVVDALRAAEPYVEICHSLISKKDTRAQVWKVLKQIRAALATTEGSTDV